ncbi:MAG TPA: protein translocase subunit SecF [Candidatus Ozemobacteraceae bacterium]|nr:protein translocase subunit SecF [Candidatus Ozemobacteraceae bacterium]
MKYNFMGYRNHCFAFSITLMVLSLVLMLARGFEYGIDFKGGNIIRVRFDQQTTEGKIREVFDKMPGLYFKGDQLVIQAVAEAKGAEFIIQYPAPLMDTVETGKLHGEILKELKANIPFRDDSLEVANVGPTVGDDMKRQAIYASILAVIGILLYLGWQFELQSSTGAVISLVHDLVIILGFISLFKIEFDITVLAALMTLLGYSVNDSIVVLDRIRENRRITKETDFVTLINDSINQTLGRTINTGMPTLFATCALMFLGGQTLFNFALVLTFGLIFGTYSSVFIASPVLLLLSGNKLNRRGA